MANNLKCRGRTPAIPYMQTLRYIAELMTSVNHTHGVSTPLHLTNLFPSHFKGKNSQRFRRYTAVFFRRFFHMYDDDER